MPFVTILVFDDGDTYTELGQIVPSIPQLDGCRIMTIKLGKNQDFDEVESILRDTRHGETRKEVVSCVKLGGT